MITLTTQKNSCASGPDGLAPDKDLYGDYVAIVQVTYRYIYTFTINEPAHVKTYNKTSVTSKDSGTECIKA